MHQSRESENKRDVEVSFQHRSTRKTKDLASDGTAGGGERQTEELMPASSLSWRMQLVLYTHSSMRRNLNSPPEPL